MIVAEELLMREGEVVVSNLRSGDILQNGCRLLCYTKMQEISLASGWKFVTLVTLQAPLFLCGSEKVLSLQVLWVFNFWNSNSGKSGRLLN